MASGYFDKYHIFRDPIHGYIKVYDFERDLINTPAFQRLRRIKQLGLTNLVHHGADHTRFAHSLGVMDLADRTIQILLTKPQSGRLLKWKKKKVEVERNRALIRLLALLHDVGHSPFSHAGEKDLFPGGMNHKTYAARVIREDAEIADLLDGCLKNRYGIGKEEIGDFFDNGVVTPPILGQIIDGPLDVDRMDYLLRDSLYTGVEYGKFDLDRLLHTLTVVKHPVSKEIGLGIEEGGVYTAEALMLARYYMFLQVYFHPVRRAYDLHIRDFVKEELGSWPDSVSEFLKWDDVSIYELIRSKRTCTDRGGRLADRIVTRRHYEKVWDTQPNIGANQRKLFFEYREKLGEKLRSLQMPEDYLVDEAKDFPNKFQKEVFYFEVRSPRTRSPEERYRLVEVRSQIIKEMPSEVNIMRLYMPPEDGFREIREWASKNKGDFM